MIEGEVCVCVGGFCDCAVVRRDSVTSVVETGLLALKGSGEFVWSLSMNSIRMRDRVSERERVASGAQWQ